MSVYLHHYIRTRPRTWREVADKMTNAANQLFEPGGGLLYGIWRPQIGRPREELTAMTVWSDAETGGRAVAALLTTIPEVVGHDTVAMVPTLRPQTVEPPRRQGNFAFRWFDTPASNWDEFLDLCAGAWPGFEAAYDSQVVGLWRVVPHHGGSVRSLLLTRRPDLAMWERSKIPQGSAESEVRRKLSRRYDLCDDTVVYTTTLLTAEDKEDTARWT